MGFFGPEEASLQTWIFCRYLGLWSYVIQFAHLRPPLCSTVFLQGEGFRPEGCISTIYIMFEIYHSGREPSAVNMTMIYRRTGLERFTISFGIMLCVPMPSSINGFSPLSKAKINAMSTLSNFIAELSLRTKW